MGTIYFTRHGQTIWNVENKICGATDIALTAHGQEQALALGRQIADGNYNIDGILSSPLMRALHTANYISEMTHIPVRIEPRLREQNFGKYESTPRDGRTFQQAKACFINHYAGGESMLQMAQRIYNLLDELKKEQNTTYLLVAHNGIARFMESYFRDMTNEEFAKFGIGNCEIKEYHW